VNRKDLQALANLRAREAQVLLRAKEFSGAYYLAGYAVECALKACIAKQNKRHDFPERKVVNDSWTHDLKKLASVAKIDEAMVERSSTDEIFQKNWNLITLWSEESRYRTTDKAACMALLDATMEADHGVISWIRQRW
jgi:HEPN domain-containing protein